MNTKRFYSFLTIIAMLGLLAIMPQPAQANGAVNAANSGDTVHASVIYG